MARGWVSCWSLERCESGSVCGMAVGGRGAVLRKKGRRRRKDTIWVQDLPGIGALVRGGAGVRGGG